MQKYIYCGLGVLIITLCSILGHQANVIKSLELTNAEQAKTIETQSSSIKQLKAEIEENERLTFELSESDNKTREETNAIIKSIPKSDRKSSAFNSAAPNSIINFLRQ